MAHRTTLPINKCWSRNLSLSQNQCVFLGDGYFAPYQKALWDLFEKPQSSVPAKFISIVSILMVLVSTVGMCLNTFKWIQKQDVNGDPVDNPYLAMIEAVCISYFSIEFLLR